MKYAYMVYDKLLTHKGKTMTRKQLLLLLLLWAVSMQAYAERIKDLAFVSGVRSNHLVGYGLVVGLNGAGGMVDPAKIQVADMAKSVQDPLLSKTRRLLRQNYNFPTNLSRRFHIPCVFSGEYLTYPDGKGGVSSEKPSETATSGLNCAGGFGSSVCVTAPFGFFAAGYVLRKLVEK